MNQSFLLGMLCGGAIAVGVCNWPNKTVVVICAIVAVTIAVIANVLP